MEKAIRYAEKYGVVEFHMSGENMIYYSSFPMEKTTYKCVVDLETMSEKRTPLRKYYKPYKAKICGKYQANYAI